VVRPLVSSPGAEPMSIAKRRYPMTPAKPKSKLALTVYLPAELRQQVEHEAKEDGRTLSVCVERALAEHFRAMMAAR
jgi:hypothetical protein